jgi:hypothetical protein
VVVLVVSLCYVAVAVGSIQQTGRQAGSQSLDSARVDLEICVDGAGWLAREWQWLSS